MFAKLERIVTITATFITDGNLSVNSGKGDGIRDNLVIREGGPNSNPVISGSSIKGVVRSAVEAILAQAGKQVCVPDTCVPGGPAEKRNYFNQHLRGTRKCMSSDCVPPCLACQMFGNTQGAGRVSFHDARVPNGKRITTMSRTHVAITRDTKMQAEKALMTVETVPSDETFCGDVVLINPHDWMVGAIIDVLEMLDKLGVGAKKTAGYGSLQVKIASVHERVFGDEELKNLTPAQYVEAWRKIAPSQESPESP